ncbi:hypothetical protein E4U37_006412 [Claviceps purpurea]|nr:hypothetical protein E4U37_006412 [Claviceps purpurea]
MGPDQMQVLSLDESSQPTEPSQSAQKQHRTTTEPPPVTTAEPALQTHRRRLQPTEPPAGEALQTSKDGNCTVPARFALCGLNTAS